MSTSHSAARVWMKRRFTLQTGRFLTTHDYLISSPMNTLDLLLAPSHRNSLKFIRAYCINNATAKLFRTVAQNLRSNEVWMIGDNGADNATIYAVEPRLTFRFRQINGKWKLSQTTRHIPKELESFRH
jgi:hypothetical protein